MVVQVRASLVGWTMVFVPCGCNIYAQSGTNITIICGRCQLSQVSLEIILRLLYVPFGVTSHLVAYKDDEVRQDFFIMLVNQCIGVGSHSCCKTQARSSLPCSSSARHVPIRGSGDCCDMIVGGVGQFVLCGEI